MDFQNIGHQEWAKLNGGQFCFDLSGSGAPALTASEFPPLAEPAGVEGMPGYGFSDLAALIARHYGTNRDRVLWAAGTSLANFLVAAAVVRPGDDVLVERPTYEPLRGIPTALGANLIRFDRRADAGFVPDLDEIAALTTPRTSLIMLSNLHNPSHTALPAGFLGRLHELARERRIHVLVDEVYLEFALDPGVSPGPHAAATLGPEMISTSSLTKVYGLGGLRAGWAILDGALRAHAFRVADYLGVNESTPSARISARVLRGLPGLALRSRKAAARGRAVFTDWLAGRSDLAEVAPAGGMVAFARITSGVNSRRLATHLAARYDTLVTPGEFFESPGFIRIGLGLPSERLAEALGRLGRALDDLA